MTWLVLLVLLSLPGVAHAQIAIGSRVQVTLDAAVRPTPGGALLGTQLTGASGSVIAGPDTATWGLTWWNVNFDSGVDGWVTADRLTAVVVYPGPVLAPTITRRDVNVWGLTWGWSGGNPAQTLADIERAPSATGPWTPLATTTAGATSYNDLTVVKGQSYCYRVLGRIGTTTTAFVIATPCPTP